LPPTTTFLHNPTCEGISSSLPPSVPLC
jgi:hypothetical protein